MNKLLDNILYPSLIVVNAVISFALLQGLKNVLVDFYNAEE